jgi:hypothetical protein
MEDGGSGQGTALRKDSLKQQTREDRRQSTGFIKIGSCAMPQLVEVSKVAPDCGGLREGTGVSDS